MKSPYLKSQLDIGTNLLQKVLILGNKLLKKLSKQMEQLEESNKVSAEKSF